MPAKSVNPLSVLTLTDPLEVAKLVRDQELFKRAHGLGLPKRKRERVSKWTRPFLKCRACGAKALCAEAKGWVQTGDSRGRLASWCPKHKPKKASP